MEIDVSPSVGRFISQQETKAKDKISQKLESIEKYGTTSLGMEHFQKLHGHDIYEVRIRYDKKFFRLFGTIKNSTLWLLHAFMKKSDDTPPREIKTTLNLIRELDNSLNKEGGKI